MNKIIAFEGISGSGKSTLIKEFLKIPFEYVPELSESYDPIAEFPKFSTLEEEAVLAERWFLDREIERCTLARNLSMHNSVVADRWYYSICSVAYARNKIFGTKDIPHLNREVKRLLDENSIFDPILVIVDVPVDLTLKRLHERYKDWNLMRNLNMYPEFLEKQREYYLSLANDKKAILLSGEMDPSEQYELIERSFL